MSDPKSNCRNIITFQGEPGANSHIACQDLYPKMQILPCPTFEECFAALHDARAHYAMIPVENSLAGRVADIHHLLPQSGLHIIGEYFLPVHHQLLALPGSRLEDIKKVQSHVHALGQCRKIIGELELTAEIAADTAGAARQIVKTADPACAAIASRLAAKIYGLEVVRENIEDEDHNTTRFLILSNTPDPAEHNDQLTITSLVFKVRNVPAALYKALGGFATNGVNMTKLESYQIEGSFNATQFFADIEGHPDAHPVQLALEELTFYTTELIILGIYKASPQRKQLMASA